MLIRFSLLAANAVHRAIAAAVLLPPAFEGTSPPLVALGLDRAALVRGVLYHRGPTFGGV